MTLPDPAIVVPGITATYLRDDYPLPPEVIWRVLPFQKHFGSACLHPDDLRYEAREPALIRPGPLYEVAYKELIDELRYDLSPSPEAEVPVYPFAYDWRKPLDMIEADLDAFIDEVIERTVLTRHYYKDGYDCRRTVTLIGHSMGGLIIAGFLQATGGLRTRRRRTCPDHRVSKVISLASPFRGSFEAVVKMTTGTADLGLGASSSREREAARLTPALYHLLPSFDEGLEVPAPLPRTLFDPQVWQPSILRSIETFVARTSPITRTVRKRTEALFAGLLDQARTHRERLDAFRLDQAGLGPRDWLAVVGCGADTRTRLTIAALEDGPSFVLTSDDRRNTWPNGTDTGDGTVPFLGAEPSFLDRANLVCVTPDDYGYWELEDKALTRFGGGFHGILPNMNMLHRLIVRFVTGAPDPHQKTWGRPAPGVRPDAWDPPIPGLRNKAL
ncbi:esterase/lipase family protein [Roseospira marina]|nr:alpha/beta fold hydrolase [Roseospira marina]MBB4314349.1 pimeloyl-ACP methyl ester carboxylesterase [Roseospira marina]MBB5087509.1 pimeloyl-ACP methyl ester carboxylesterase [Roseospira marina]